MLSLKDVVLPKNEEINKVSNSRLTVTASSLGDYFGVGFMEPMERLAQDLGLVEPQPIFKNIQDAMDLGNAMEDAVLDYWEEKFGTTIYDRNINTKTVLDGKLRVRKDGHMLLDGDEEVVESKFVNSGQSFINNKGYHIQVYAQIIAEQDQGNEVYNGRLLGMYQGRPHQIKLTINDEIKEDMLRMIDAVVGILEMSDKYLTENGEYPDLDVMEYMFPWELVEKYSGADLTKSEDYDEEDDVYLSEMAEIKSMQKDLKAREDELKEYLNSKYDVVEHLVLDNGYKFAIRNTRRKGGIDLDLLQTDYPELDLEKYRKEDSAYSTLTLRELK